MSEYEVSFRDAAKRRGIRKVESTRCQTCHEHKSGNAAASHDGFERVFVSKEFSVGLRASVIVIALRRIAGYHAVLSPGRICTSCRRRPSGDKRPQCLAGAFVFRGFDGVLVAERLHIAAAAKHSGFAAHFARVHCSRLGQLFRCRNGFAGFVGDGVADRVIESEAAELFLDLVSSTRMCPSDRVAAILMGGELLPN